MKNVNVFLKEESAAADSCSVPTIYLICNRVNLKNVIILIFGSVCPQTEYNLNNQTVISGSFEEERSPGIQLNPQHGLRIFLLIHNSVLDYYEDNKQSEHNLVILMCV